MDIKTVFSKCKGHATTLVWLTALIIAATVLLAYERHVLWKIQEQSLFLDTSLFFRQQMVAPGGLLTYVGSFLTQLLYYPVLGVAVLCVWWGLLLELMRRTFRIGNPWSMLLLVPIALLLVANVDMGYWIYPIKLKGWYFDATVGLTAVVALLLAYRSLSAHRMWRRVLLLLTVVVGQAATLSGTSLISRIQPSEAMSKQPPSSGKLSGFGRWLTRKAGPFTRYSIISLLRNKKRFIFSVFCFMNTFHT